VVRIERDLVLPARHCRSAPCSVWGNRNIQGGRQSAGWLGGGR